MSGALPAEGVGRRPPDARDSGEAAQEPAVRFMPASGPVPRPPRALTILTAPLGASRLLFPRRFSRAVARTSRDPFARSVPTAHARRFFSEGLILSVDPMRLTLRLLEDVADGRTVRRLGSRFLESGDWSGALQPLDQLQRHREMFQLVEFGPNYRDMPRYARLVALAREGKPARVFDKVLGTPEEIDAYFDYYLDVLDSLRRLGFRRQGELAGKAVPRGRAVRGRFADVEREVGVAIGADGALLRFEGGHHRTALAQALGLPSMPVEVRLVHAGWLRAEAERAGLPPDRALTDWIERFTAAS